MTAVQQMRVLVVGAGGLGCELLKNLAMSGFQNIDVIDMDTIDLSNLNRQFLFRESDVGKSKAEVAADFVRNRVTGCKVTAHNCRIEEKSALFYRQFALVICGLDSISARRWINSMLVNFPLCTIAHTPRLPEHCIEYVKVVQWPEEDPFSGCSLDADDPVHVDWVLMKAIARAQLYGIRGVDRRLTQGVLKRIIPAVASTNAVIAASCALEALKLASNISKPIDNYLNFTDIEGVYCGVVRMEKDVSGVERKPGYEEAPECATCASGSIPISCNIADTLKILLDKIVLKFQLKNPTLETATKKLYLVSQLIPDLEQQSLDNLEKPIKGNLLNFDLICFVILVLFFVDLLSSEEEVLVADEVLSKPIMIRVHFDD
uniref:NEDD8-activating enzyme E1 catalytic subunit n=1 Tax=Heterorhabditis bacteriophora TaxID=37862 RepID=A0A1I7XQ19_HETBA